MRVKRFKPNRSLTIGKFTLSFITSRTSGDTKILFFQTIEQMILYVLAKKDRLSRGIKKEFAENRIVVAAWSN